MHVLNEAWKVEGRRLGVLVRYCEYVVVLSPTRQRAEQAQLSATEVPDRLGLRLRPERSGITCLIQGGQGFGFLGFHHRKVESWKGRGTHYSQRWPPAGAMRVLRDKVRAATVIEKTEQPLCAVVADLNPVLRDWGAYFRNGNSGRTFNAVNGYVHERRAIRAKRQHGLWCRNWSTRFTYGWTTRLRVYRLTGTVRRATAHARR
ncbi:group II intron maturase-specific domain-containing protein [Streptomyces sp. MUSC 125]|uniref:group II intron maturase-specific domain-containing protein n=1 Tax=Streptomyces sp. MUSC 125 TaxID=1428624 RepID=UPI000ADEAEA3|nr:group II intron maturase-specific domain-containing protein [Streptomyces sp. MUSC 125]